VSATSVILPPAENAIAGRGEQCSLRQRHIDMVPDRVDKANPTRDFVPSVALVNEWDAVQKDIGLARKIRKAASDFSETAFDLLELLSG
jgi:hypothetical protein